eukprot:gnl/TRDRNA2_/TRDRNA2_154798_c2_seq1.p1 gnl/TRDRNA2_/TRDRNA2_154798_c2~~gnl/TRDRNA2_/TRDRNA2_154798_c2_seq1.p1  ORF type:complete len:395 (+),score=55.83 gnl/TRDRNA2_/TRDRNA2_154798_c2_seq1:60-1244(+)
MPDERGGEQCPPNTGGLVPSNIGRMSKTPAGGGIFTLNHYDKHRTICPTDDKATAARLGGHTWNIINNSEEHEIYLRHARNSEHFVDEQNRTTNVWFARRKHVSAPGAAEDSHANDSHLTEQCLACPPTAGKEAAHRRVRQTIQICQSENPNDWNMYSARKHEILPRTPDYDPIGKTIKDQKRLRDLPQRPKPQLVEKELWSARRNQACFGTLRPEMPNEQDMFKAVDQIRAESTLDAFDANFAESLMSQARSASSRRAGDSGASSARARGGPPSARSASRVPSSGPQSARGPMPGAVQEARGGPSSARGGGSTLPPPAPSLGASQDPRTLAGERTRLSKQRINTMNTRDISSWALDADKLRRQDPFYMKPMAHNGNSSVKYDIISNEQKSFWY